MRKETRHSDFGFIFWLHLAVIIIFLSSPFWVRWEIVLVGILLYYLQLLIFGGCILTRAEFGESDHNSFYWYYLTRIGFTFSKKKVDIFVDYFLPAILLITALIVQIF